MGDMEVGRDLQSFQSLQYELFQSGVVVSTHIAPNEEALLDILRVSTTAVNQTEAAHISLPTPCFDLVPYCSLEKPMSQKTFLSLTDTTASMSDLAGLRLGGEQVNKLARSGLDDDCIEACVEFWASEWICE